MELAQLKTLEGRVAEVAWTDRRGEILSQELEIYEVAFVPMYGPCLVTPVGNISVARVQSAEIRRSAAA